MIWTTLGLETREGEEGKSAGLKRDEEAHYTTQRAEWDLSSLDITYITVPNPVCAVNISEHTI